LYLLIGRLAELGHQCLPPLFTSIANGLFSTLLHGQPHVPSP